MDNKATERIALITGATSGIGKATADLFAANNIKLILCGRRENRLQEMKQTLASKTSVHTLCFDVSDKEATFSAIQNIPNEFKEINILVNNAGNAHGLSPIDQGDPDDWDAMIDSNVKGLLYVTKATLPFLAEQNNSHIINIGSIAGKEVYPNGNVYCASKHAVDALSKGMMIDLVSHGIKVSAINPGLVNTEFSNVRFKDNQDKADAVYKGMTPLQGSDIANVILFVINCPEHVNIADLTIFPSAQASAVTVHRSSV